MGLAAGEITAIVAVAGNMAAWAKLFSDQKKYAKAANGNGGGPRMPCGLHINLAERVGKIEGAAERLRADMSIAHLEDRDCFNRIFQGLEAVKVDAAVTREKATSAQAAVKEITDTMERRRIPR
jgi:hypothetical protein